MSVGSSYTGLNPISNPDDVYSCYECGEDNDLYFSEMVDGKAHCQVCAKEKK